MHVIWAQLTLKKLTQVNYLNAGEGTLVLELKFYRTNNQGRVSLKILLN